MVEKTYEAAHPDVDVRWLDMGSQEVYDRVRSEKANPQADVWFGGPNTIFARGARETVSWSPTARRGRPRSRRRAGTRSDLYFGVYRTPAVIVYNSGAVAGGRRAARLGRPRSTRAGRGRS